jgi:hypothetical protein
VIEVNDKEREMWVMNDEMLWYGMEGQSISCEAWRKLYANGGDRGVAKTFIRPGWHVSTVLVGLDHGFEGGAPLIFETMIFHRKTGWMDWCCRRYSTKEEALLGHREAVASLRNLRWVWKGLGAWFIGRRAKRIWR